MGQPQSVLREMQRLRPEPYVISYGAAISARELGQLCEQPLRFLRERRSLRLERDAISYGAASSVCEMGQLFEESQRRLREMRRLHLEVSLRPRRFLGDKHEVHQLSVNRPDFVPDEENAGAEVR